MSNRVCVLTLVLLGLHSQVRAQTQLDDWTNHPLPITEEFVAATNVIFGFRATERYGGLIFTGSRKPFAGEASDDPIAEQYDWYPGILTELTPGQWQLLAPPLERNGFVHVCRSQSGRYVFALLDNLPEAPGNELETLRSADGGKTWEQLPPIPKPVYMSGVRDIMFDESTGAGKLYIIQPDPEVFQFPGMHVYQTLDWGKTWNKIEYVRGTNERPAFGDSTRTAPLAGVPGFAEMAVELNSEGKSR